MGIEPSSAVFNVLGNSLKKHTQKPLDTIELKNNIRNDDRSANSRTV